MFCIVYDSNEYIPYAGRVHSGVCFRARSFYDFYGNTTQVRNIHGDDGITIPSFIV